MAERVQHEDAPRVGGDGLRHGKQEECHGPHSHTYSQTNGHTARTKTPGDSSRQGETDRSGGAMPWASEVCPSTPSARARRYDRACFENVSPSIIGMVWSPSRPWICHFSDDEFTERLNGR